MSDYIDYEVMTDKQIEESYLLPDGQYLADVHEAFDKDANNNYLMTKNGVRKFDVTLDVYDTEGKPRKVKCSLTPAFMKLFKHFFDATGQQEAYEAKKINLQNIRGKRNFVVELGKRSYVSQKTGDTVYINNVNDFLPKGGAKVNSGAESFDDPIPF